MSKVGRLAILGVSGSVGSNALNIALDHKVKISLVSCHRNKEFIVSMIDNMIDNNVDLPCVICTDPATFSCLYNHFKESNIILELATTIEQGYSIVGHVCYTVVAVPGISSLNATMFAIKNSDKVALASKESVICGWRALKQYADKIVPIDSEHNAIYKLAKLYPDFEKIMITASGGPFFNKGKNLIENATPELALNHPIWKMGRTISVNSATLANKGMEVIEACKLFDIDHSIIDVVIHPMSIIHGCVYDKTGSTAVEMYNPSMRIPIMHALGIKEDREIPRVDFIGLQRLEFFEPDTEKFPILQLARDVCSGSEEDMVVFHIANEIGVNKFLRGDIRLTEIPDIISRALDSNNERIHGDNINDVLQFYIKCSNTLL